MIVRPMKPTERETVAEIYLRDRQRYFPWVAHRTNDFDHDSRGEALFVAEINGQIAVLPGG